MTRDLDQLASAAADAASAAVLSLSDDDIVVRLDTLHAVEQIVHAAKLRAVREADGRGIPARQRASSANTWLRNRLHVSTAEAGRMLHGARLLHNEPALEAAMLAGRLSGEQLTAIGKTLQEIPRDTSARIRADVVTALAGFAADLEPAALRVAGERIQAHVAPDEADAREEKRLRDCERSAHERRFFTLSPTGDGAVRLQGLIDTESAATITAALDPLCAPSRAVHDMAETGQAATARQRRADALLDVFRLALSTENLPANGGDRPQLTVSTSWDVLRQQLGPGSLENGDRVSAATVRRLACDARLLPIVLGGTSQILDAGYSRRLAGAATRRALTARDAGCTFPGCDRPARWCQAHHLTPWSAGGRTDVDNLALICSVHHRLLHTEPDWQARIGPDGHPEYLPPAWLDPNQIPRRNPYHRRE